MPANNSLCYWSLSFISFLVDLLCSPLTLKGEHLRYASWSLKWEVTSLFSWLGLAHTHVCIPDKAGKINVESDTARERKSEEAQ